ncbi:MAG: polysaccharide biosynthesis C-terminal domain-containing protein, partial [Bacteroidales bacterium]|nr:polysaccharide biosynthesis C-terminal domain-containing protein [Bacteroidales bacterium]
GVLIGATGLILVRPLVTLLGATPDIVPQTIEYIRYILIATPFMMSSIVMNNQLRHQGNATFSMIGLASGSILNILLDYLLIIKLEMGISGASMATCISQVCSWLLLLGGTMRAGSVHIRPSLFSPTLQNYHQIMRGGLPSIFRQGFSALSTLFLNYAAAHYAMPGQEASTIAAFTIVSRVMLFVYSMILGFGQGFQPVCGFNYGAGNYRRVRLAYGFTLSGSFLLLCCSSTLLILFAPQVIALFRSEDAALIAIGARVMRWQSVIMPTAALVTITNMLYQNIGRTVPATILASLRQGMFFIPILFISPLFFGIDGVITAQAVADLLAFLFAIPFTVKILRELKKTPHKA